MGLVERECCDGSAMPMLDCLLDWLVLRSGKALVKSSHFSHTITDHYLLFFADCQCCYFVVMSDVSHHPFPFQIINHYCFIPVLHQVSLLFLIHPHVIIILLFLVIYLLETIYFLVLFITTIILIIKYHNILLFFLESYNYSPKIIQEYSMFYFILFYIQLILLD